jgi:lipopolysaccharide transport system ATP-binding protein
MSSKKIAIQVMGLGKCYSVYNKPIDRLKQALLSRIKNAFGLASHAYYREFWALKNVSLDVYKGETVGIIGRNGSGKSTLLQMICGTLDPTTGSVETYGRIAALLELGAGFNPEFTGRENVFMNASILGLSNAEISERFDEIAEFADIGEFIDQPVKHYSSGMYARLAFAVAINVDPDILIVDEALAVGDEPFQRKCFARIDQIKNNGGTILFVSHSGGTIINLCDRAILLNSGERLFTGTPKRAVFFAQKIGNTQAQECDSVIAEIRNADTNESDQLDDTVEELLVDSTDESGSCNKNSQTLEFYDSTLVPACEFTYDQDGAEISGPVLETLWGERVNHVLRGRKYRLKCNVIFNKDCPAVRFYALIRTTTGIDLAGCSHPVIGERGVDFKSGVHLTLSFEFECRLNPATYFCNFAIQGADGSLHHRIVDSLVFRVMEDSPSPATGLIDIGFKPEIKFS